MGSNKTLHVLVVDDNTPDVVLIAESILEQGLSHNITHCMNGKEALDVLYDELQSPYDLIILDLNMPKVGGLEVLAKLRQTPQLEHVPVLVLTSSMAPDEQDQALKLGADKFLRKPADLDQFLCSVGRAVRELAVSTCR